MCAVQGYPCSRSAVRLGEPHLLPRQYLWLGHRRKPPLETPGEAELTTQVVVPFNEIRLVEKKMTALVIPNAIGISTGKEKVCS